MDAPLLGAIGEDHSASPQPQPQSRETCSNRCTWLQTTATLLTLQLGWGLWLLPSDFARLGWIPGGVALALFALLTMYSGFLFCRLFHLVPGSVLFGDIGERISGKTGRAVVYAIIYSLDATRCIILHLAASQSMQHIFPADQQPDLWWCGLGVVVIAGILTQVRALSELSWVFVIGTVSQLIAIGIVVADLVQNPDPNAETHMAVPLTPQSFADAAVAVLNLVFAFGGQFAFIEIISAMRKPSQFPRAINVCTTIMAVLYGAVGVIGYWSRGNEIAEIVIFSLKPGPLSRIAAGFILLQAIAQYLVNLNVWSHNLLTLVARHHEWDKDNSIECSSDHSPKTWFLTSMFILAYSFAISMSIPFFSTLVGLVTSVTYLTCAYALPAYFTLKAAGSKLHFLEKGLLVALIPLSVLMSAVGLYCSIMALIDDLKEGGSGGPIGVTAQSIYVAAASAVHNAVAE